MAMYRIINNENGLIYSDMLGWVKEDGNLYGHVFELEEAKVMSSILSAEGIPVTIKKDKVASRFVLMASIDFRKLLFLTVIGFFALFCTYYLTKDMDFTNKTGDPLQEFRESLPFYSTIEPYSPYLVVILTLMTIGVFILVILDAAKEKNKQNDNK